MFITREIWGLNLVLLGISFVVAMVLLFAYSRLAPLFSELSFRWSLVLSQIRPLLPWPAQLLLFSLGVFALFPLFTVVIILSITMVLVSLLSRLIALITAKAPSPGSTVLRWLLSSLAFGILGLGATLAVYFFITMWWVGLNDALEGVERLSGGTPIPSAFEIWPRRS